jgi:hypothetical protein
MEFPKTYETIHKGERFPDNPGLTSFDYQHNNVVSNINRKILPDQYKNTTGLQINNNQYPPYHSSFKPYHQSNSSFKPYHQSNSTIGSYPDFYTIKKLDNFTVKSIVVKLSKLRLHLLSYFDENKVISILAYLYHESISQKSSKPIDEYLNFLSFQLD